MKSKYFTLQICLQLLFNIQIVFCQSLLVTNYNNNFTPQTCGSSSDDWAKCQCNGGTWPRNSNAPYEWKRVGEGNSTSDHLSYNKIFGLSGTVFFQTVAGSDFPFSHVFGYNPHDPNNKLFVDWESYIVVDAPYVNLLGKGNLAKNKDGTAIDGEYTTAINKAKRAIADLNGRDKRYASLEYGVMGVEFESGMIPFAYRSQEKDRTAVFGDLIADCGHDEGGFHTEIHPPLLLVNARPFSGSNPLNSQQKIGNLVTNVTFASVISQPYHITQLFNDGQTFLNASGLEMFKAISAAEGWGWLTGWLAPTYQLRLSADIADKPFRGNQSMSFDVYPQKPRGSGDEILWYQYHFTVRNGVLVSINPAYDHLTVTVFMNESAYKSANNLLDKHTQKLDHNNFSSEYGDVYAGAFLGADIIPGVGPIVQQGIETTVYTTPRAHSGFDGNIFPSTPQSGLVADTSDDQPFPIYGWMTVGWRKRPEITSVCTVHPPQINSNVNEVNFFPNNATKSQLVTIANPTDAPIRLGKLYVDGTNPDGFVLQNRNNILIFRRGGSQPPEDCSNTTLQPHTSCSFRVAMLPNSGGYNLNGVINIPWDIPWGVTCPLKIPIHQLNGVN